MGRRVIVRSSKQQQVTSTGTATTNKVSFNNRFLSLLFSSACDRSNTTTTTSQHILPLWQQQQKTSTATKNNFVVDENFVDVEAPECDDEIDSEDEEDLNFSLYDPEILRARIIRPLPRKHESVYGGELVLTCLTSVLFPVDIEWFLNGEIIEPTLDGRVYFTEDRRQLVVAYVTHEDEGTVEVIARNRFGSEHSRCTLRIMKRTRAATDVTLAKPRDLDTTKRSKSVLHNT